MPRFQIGGTKRNTLSAFEAKALEQGGDSGYSKAGRGYLSKIVKSVQDALKDVPDDANLTVVGNVDTTGSRLTIQLEIYANHPDLESVGERYGEPNVGEGARPSAEPEKLADTGENKVASAKTTPSTVTSGAPATEGPEGSASIAARGTEGGFEGATSPPSAAADSGIGRFTGADK